MTLEPSRPTIRVLYADDDPEVSVVVQTYFERMAPECSLETVPNGQSCLDRMQRGGIDVLMLDFELPDIDGLHILSELASRRERREGEARRRPPDTIFKQFFRRFFHVHLSGTSCRNGALRMRPLQSRLPASRGRGS